MKGERKKVRKGERAMIEEERDGGREGKEMD